MRAEKVLRFEPVEYLVPVSYSPIQRKKIDSPADDNLLRVDFMMQVVHRPVVIHVHRHLLAGLAVKHSKRRADLHPRVCPRTKESSQDPILLVRPSQVMVENREKSHRVDRYTGRCPPACRSLATIEKGILGAYGAF